MEGLEKVTSGIASYTPEQKQIAMRRVGVIGGGVIAVGALGVATPLIFSALSGAVALVGLGSIAVVGYITSRYIPYLGQKMENNVLALRKAEARENPIEQLENSYIKRENKLGDSRKALAIIATNIASMRSQLEEQAKSDPDHDLTAARRSYDSMVNFYNVNIGRHKKAKEELEKFKRAIGRRKWELQFAQNGQTAMTALADAQGNDPTQQVLSEEAIQSIKNQFDEVFATMELDAILEQADQIQATVPRGNILDAEFTSTN